MTTNDLKMEMQKRLELYTLTEKVDWASSEFREHTFRELSNEKVLQAVLWITDYAALGAIREIIKELCVQLEHRYPTIRIEKVFRSGWALKDLTQLSKTAPEDGAPLCPGIRYLATLQSGGAQISAIVDVELHEQDADPSPEDVRRFIEHRLSGGSGGGWKPEAEPLLMAGADVVKYFAGKRLK